jgi:hypothetical protein
MKIKPTSYLLLLACFPIYPAFPSILLSLERSRKEAGKKQERSRIEAGKLLINYCFKRKEAGKHEEFCFWKKYFYEWNGRLSSQ